MNTRPVGVELFHANRHEEANSAFHSFANVPKKEINILYY
jgi:hypothetical protein